MLPYLLPPAFAAPEMIPLDVFEAAKTAKPVDPATDVTFSLQDGGTFRLSEQKGRRVLLAFWASWCAPCRRELPALSTWAATHPDIDILAVGVDRTPKDAEKFLATVRFDLRVAFDPDARYLGTFGATSMPTMFLFDRKGALAWRHTGYSDENGFRELEAALSGAK